MQYMIVLALACLACAAAVPDAALFGHHSVALTPDGFLQDTPEVAFEKYRHLTEHHKAAIGAHAGLTHAVPIATSPDYRYSGVHAIPQVSPDGFLLDTPEVAFEKYRHLTEHHKAATAAHAGLIHGAPIATSPDYRYSGVHAVPQVSPDGFLLDTPEVAFEKYRHLSEHHKAATAAHAGLIHAF